MNTRTISPDRRCAEETAGALHQHEIPSPAAAADVASGLIVHSGPAAYEIDVGEQLLVTPREQLAVWRSDEPPSTSSFHVASLTRSSSAAVAECR
jgi:hypothetical protein